MQRSPIRLLSLPFLGTRTRPLVPKGSRNLYKKFDSECLRDEDVVIFIKVYHHGRGERSAQALDTFKRRSET